MATGQIIVIGASAGGVEALQTLMAGLPADLQAPVCVVLHIGRQRSELPGILDEAGPLAARHASDGETLHHGHVYIAPPDYHLQVYGDHLHLIRGPRENHARPAIDPLFRSAAAYGSGAIGVILSGTLNDGTAGLFELKRHGGTAVVQALADARHPEMPCSALEHVTADHCVAVADMAPLLARLLAATPSREHLVRVQAMQNDGPTQQDYPLERPVTLGCPECGGALRKSQLGTLTQYRCHIGHAYTAEIMAQAQLQYMEMRIETALRTINERAEMCREMAERPDLDDPAVKQEWYEAMREAEARAEAIANLMRSGWRMPEG